MKTRILFILLAASSLVDQGTVLAMASDFVDYCDLFQLKKVRKDATVFK